MRFRLLIIAAMFVASCATQQPPALDQPKSLSNNRDRDLSECERESAFAGAGDKRKAFDNCMKARGY
jgi:hypothetical protein